MKPKRIAILHIVVALIFAVAIMLVSALIDDAELATSYTYVLIALYMIPFGILSVYAIPEQHHAMKKYWWVYALVLVLLLVWIELAVGIFGTPFAGT